MENLFEEQSAFDFIFSEEERVTTEIEENGYALSELPLWLFDRDAMKVQPRQVFRMDLGEKRYYYDFLDDLKTLVNFYISITSSIANPLFLETSKGLMEYYNNFDRIEDVYRDMNRKADYGTFAHILISMYWKNKQLNLDEIKSLVFEYKEKRKLDYDNRHWIKRAKRDVIAVDKWQKEHNVKPLAVELCLTSRNYGFASAVDFVCEMDIGSGVNGNILKKDKDVQRITAIIDWKTGKGFYNSSAFQLEAYRRLMNENFPNLKIDKLFNIRFEGSWRDAKCIVKEQTLAEKTIDFLGMETTLFDLEWERYKAYYPNYNNPQNFDEVTGYIDVLETDTYKFNPKNPTDIVIQKHRKY